MPALAQVLIPYVLGGTLVLAVALFLLALWYFRRGKREPYWRMRRDASRVGWRLFLASLALFGISGAGLIATGLASLVLIDAPVEPEAASVMPTSARSLATFATVTPSPEPLWTASPAPSVTVIFRATPTGRPPLTPSTVPASAQTPTPPPLPTVTVTPTRLPTVTPPAIEPLPSGVPPIGDVLLVIDGVAAQVDAEFQLVDPELNLPAGLNRLYFALTYSGMSDGVAWERALFRDGALVQGGAYLWRAGESGTIVHFFGDTTGFPAGEYTVRVTLGGRVAAEQAFVLE